MKKFALLVLTLCLMVSSVAYAADMNSEEYISVVAQVLPDAEDMVIDYDNYYGQVLHGYYNYDCFVNEDVTRTAKFYIPENTVYNQPTVFITVPAGVNTYGFLVESGWKDAADKYVFHVVLMETDESGEWGDLDSEMAYLSALRDDVSYRPFFVSWTSNFYAVAYGNAADVLLQHAMANPNQWAAVACIGTTGVSDEFIAEMQSTESKEEGIMKSEVPMPIFLVAEEKTDAVQKVVDYYKAANDVEDVTYSCDYADEVYIPKFWTDKDSLDTEPIAKVYYSTASVEKYYEADTIDHIYNDFLCKYLRYPGNGNGALRSAPDIYEIGFEKFEAKVPGGYAEDGSDLYNREWYVYVPESVSEDKAAPVVFVYHGAGGTGDEIAGRTGWNKIADEYGCILVCPTGSHTLSIRNVSDMTTNELFRAMWNTGDATEGRPDDKVFIRWLYNWMCENYNIDTGRVYATGQSSGGAMTIACAGYLSDIFTACGAVSATSSSVDSYVAAQNIPLLVATGTKDPYFSAYGFGSTPENVSGAFGDAKTMIDYWTERYNTIEKWGDFTYLVDDNCSYISGNARNYVFHTQSGVPMLRCIETINKVHAYLPSEASTIWNEWFAPFKKDVEGNLYYMNRLVEIEK